MFQSVTLALIQGASEDHFIKESFIIDNLKIYIYVVSAIRCLNNEPMVVQLEAKPEQYGEYLEIVNRLGIFKLQHILEGALQMLAEENKWLIHCVNIAADPVCRVRFFSHFRRKVLLEHCCGVGDVLFNLIAYG